jgi:hypothetical protein
MHPTAATIATTPKFTYEQLKKKHRMTDIQIKEAPFCPSTISESKSSKAKIQQFTMLGEFFKINKVFNDNDIECINLKGPLLSYKLYKDWGARQSKDLDILVNSDDIEKASDILMKMGYKAENKIPSTKRKRKLFISSNHHTTLYHPIKKIQIELHWKLLGLKLTNEKKLQNIVKTNTTSSKYQEHLFQEFTPELELCFLIIHGAEHAWERLKWLSDIDKYINTTDINIPKLNSLIKQLKVERIFSLTDIILTKYYSNTYLSDNLSFIKNTKVPKFTIKHCYNSINTISSLSILSTPISSLRYFQSLTPGINGIYNLISTYNISIYDIEVINLPDFLTPLYYVLRPIIWLKRRCFK